jgi:hypothetical protein
MSGTVIAAITAKNPNNISTERLILILITILLLDYTYILRILSIDVCLL